MTAGTSIDPYPPNLARRTNAQWRELYEQNFTPNFGVRRLALVRGKGSRVWDAEGREYLDFLAGISVNNLGHCHPRITKAIQEQAETLVHCTNLYYIPVQIELARLLTANCFAERIFLCNSGLEANEAAIKIVRRWAWMNRGHNVNHIISMRASFHGRSITTLSATGQDKLWKGFYPLARGFYFCEFNDLEAFEKLITKNTCAVILEPIQGEGGIRPADPEFLAGVRRLCDRHNMLLVFDEIQCGLARAGSLFAHQAYGITPDVMTLAKSLGGGLAMGAMLTTAKVAAAFEPGTHGSTMGGNPLTCAAALAYLSELIEGDYATQAGKSGRYLMQKLSDALVGCDNVVKIHGRGLMIGIEIKKGGPDIVRLCEEDGLLINFTGGRDVRILPPLNVAREDIDHAVPIIAKAIRSAG
jgi:acetylornithine/N-succinyldiaminopimelate aminotransferase